MQTIAFRLETGDKNYGEVYLPDNFTGKLPVIIYCHGWGGNRQLGPMAKVLRDRAMQLNYAFVAFDFFGCGETGGNYSFMTYTRWKENLSEIFAWCEAQPFADKNKIGCYSVSSGTTAALRFGAESHRLAFIVSVATAISIHIGMQPQGGPANILANHANELLAGEKIELFGTMFGLDFFVDTVSRAPVHTIKEIQCPVLFLQGLQDNAFRCSDARLAYDIMRRAGLPGKLIEYSEGGHGLDENGVAEQATEDLFRWLTDIQF